MRRSKVRHWVKTSWGRHTLMAWCGRSWNSWEGEVWDPITPPGPGLRTCKSCQRAYYAAVHEAFPPDPPEGYS